MKAKDYPKAFGGHPGPPPEKDKGGRWADVAKRLRRAIAARFKFLSTR